MLLDIGWHWCDCMSAIVQNCTSILTLAAFVLHRDSPCKVAVISRRSKALLVKVIESDCSCATESICDDNETHTHTHTGWHKTIKNTNFPSDINFTPSTLLSRPQNVAEIYGFPNCFLTSVTQLCASLSKARNLRRRQVFNN